MRAVCLTLLALALTSSLAALLRPRFTGIRAGHADADYLPSFSCANCHSNHFQSWAATHHSRMTREARPGTVLGDFARSNSFTYLGVTASLSSNQNGFRLLLDSPGSPPRSFSIDRVVGSRRMEQYLTRLPGRFERLPVAYDLVNHRWLHLNGSFFYPDSTNYFQHQALWDGNCVFCHNVKAQPHYSKTQNSFETEVSELGIACGACHGPAAHHEETASSPVTRTAWRVAHNPATSIVNPLKIDSDRALMICGHCHGQRLPRPIDRIDELVSRGDPYNPGDDLSVFFEPISNLTSFAHISFASRFWSNGSPRLTAYEYQGILRSKCYQAGPPGHRLQCLTCHTMHGGDPEGQITELNRGNSACLQCHPKFSTPQSLAAHSGHKPDSSGSRCYECHMPRVVYGIMSAHPTHEITVPDPQLTASAAVPNACNQCHLDRSVNWAIRASSFLWPTRFPSARTSPDDQFDLPEGPRALFAGDAVARALAAEALARQSRSPVPTGFAAPFLIEALADNYAIVRFCATAALTNSAGRRPDYLAPLAQLAVEQWQLQQALNPALVAEAAILARRARTHRADVQIEVGE